MLILPQMRLTWLPIAAVCIAAAVTYLWVDASVWNDAKTGLLAALSVIAAATLVRLARGMPFTNPDQFEAEEVEKVVAAVKQLSRSLRALLGVTLLAMVLLVVVPALTDSLARLRPTPPWLPFVKAVLSASVGATLAFAMARLWQIVGSDLSLLDRQGSILIRAVHRKERKKDEDKDQKSEVPGFKTPEGYGKRLQ